MRFLAFDPATVMLIADIDCLLDGTMSRVDGLDRILVGNPGPQGGMLRDALLIAALRPELTMSAAVFVMASGSDEVKCKMTEPMFDLTGATRHVSRARVLRVIRAIEPLLKTLTLVDELAGLHGVLAALYWQINSPVHANAHVTRSVAQNGGSSLALLTGRALMFGLVLSVEE